MAPLSLLACSVERVIVHYDTLFTTEQACKPVGGGNTRRYQDNKRWQSGR